MGFPSSDFLIVYAKPFCPGKVDITKAMVLAGRNVAAVAGGGRLSRTF